MERKEADYMAAPGIVNPVSQHTVILHEPPCCLEFVPLYPDHFVVGTYQLEKSSKDVEQSEGNQSTLEPQSQSRHGQLYLFKIIDEAIHEIHKTPVEAAILDIKFAPQADSGDTWDNVFAVATSTGFISLHEVVQLPGRLENDLELQCLQRIQVLSHDILITSLAWCPHSPGLQAGTVCMLALTTTAGDVLEIDMAHLRRLKTENPGLAKTITTTPLIELQEESLRPLIVQSHQGEAWLAAYIANESPSQPWAIMSGGDDSCVILSSPRDNAATAAEDIEQSGWSNRKIHGAGVTAITPLFGCFIATGSYDDRLRIVQTPQQQGLQPRTVHELNLGGGVWRIKVFAVAEDAGDYEARLLISCMYAGAFIVRIRTDARREQWESKVLAHFQEHESMNYACDLMQGETSRETERSFVSCSFYDRRVCLWRA